MNMISCTALPYLLFLTVLVATMVPVYTQDQVECRCNCMRNRNNEQKCRRLTVNLLDFTQNEGFLNPPCDLQRLDKCVQSLQERQQCRRSDWRCCEVNDSNMECITRAESFTGGRCGTSEMHQDCYFVNCTCKWDSSSREPTTQHWSTTQFQNKKHKQKLSSTSTSLGIGLGIGFVAVIAVMIALMIYCRKQGIKQGSKQKTAAPVHTCETKGENDLGEYAEISDNLYQGEQGLTGTTNPGYDTVNGIITNRDYTHLAQPNQISHYQSLKKSSNDFGTPDYIDPEKYTEPPKLKPTNGIETTDNKDNEKYTGTPMRKSDNDLESPAYTDPKKYTKPEMPSTHNEQDGDTDDYVTQYDMPKPIGKNGKGHFSSLSEGSGNEEEPKNADYVDVDDPSLSKNKTISSAVGSDYVDVDDPSLKKGQAQNVSPATSDYVDVDDPSLSTRMSSTRSDGDYVDM